MIKQSIAKKFFAASAIALGLSSIASVASAETLRWLTWKTETAGDAQTANINWFVDQIKKRTNGKMDVQVLWGGSAAAQKEIPDAISAGVGQIGEIVIPYYMNKFVLNNGVGFYTPQPLGPAELGDLMANWHEKYPQFDKELAKYNLKALGYRPLEKYGILCKEPLRTLDDFKGRKIRTYGSAYPALVKALGGIPTATSTTEMREALERGILDCTPTSLTYIRGFKLDEVAKYFTDVPFGANYGHFIVMNRKYYDSLDPQTRKVLDQIGRENAANFVSQIDPIVAQLKKQWASSKDGVQIIDFPQDAFVEVIKDPAIQALRNKWITQANKAGLPADQLVEPLVFKKK